MGAEKRKTILLVEDEAITAMAEKAALEKYGYKVLIARNGEEAVAAVKEMHAIDLVLMDINLGAGMDGTEVAAAMLKKRDLPVVFLSSHMEPAVVEKTEKITSYGYVVKDSSITVLDASIKMAFKLFDVKMREKEKESQIESSLEDLQQSERRFHSLFDNMNEGVALHELVFEDGKPVNYRIVDVNDRYLKIIGVSRQHVIGKLATNIYGKLTPPYFEEYVEAVVSKKAFYFETYFASMDKHFAISVAPWGENGFATIFSDITTHIEMETELQENHARLQLAMQAAEMAWWEMDIATGNVTFAKRKAEMLGFPIEQFKHYKDFMALVHPEDHDRVMNAMRAHIDGIMERYETEYRISTRSGEYQWFLDIGSVGKRDADGNPTTVTGIVINISKRKQAESQRQDALAALHESEKSLHTAQELAHIGVWKWKIDTDVVTWTEELYRIAGLDPIRPAPTYAEHSAIYAPESWELLKTAVEKAMATSEPYRLELTLMRPDGSSRFVNAFGGAKHDSNGRVNELYGIVQDISEYKQIQETLHKSEARAQAMLRTIPDMLFRVNRQGVFLDYKADSKDLYVQSESAIIGKRYRDILPQDFADLIDLKLRATLETGTLQTFEYQLPLPGRGVHDYEARMAAIGSEEVTAIIRDISEFKLAEKALQKSELQLKTMMFNSPVVILLIQDGKLIFVNPAAEKITGWQEEEFIGKNFTSFVHKDDIKMVIEKNRERMGGDTSLAPYIIRINKKNGGLIWAEVNGTVIDLDGKPTMLGFLTDISERKQAEEEIRRQLAEKEILLKEVHHRIKNNIASIGGLISLHMQEIDNPEAIKVLQEAIGRVDSMRFLYDKLLLSEGYRDIAVKPYIGSLAAAVLSMYPEQAKIELEMRLADFQLDPKRLFPLGLIINELLTNKMKYAFTGRKTGSIKIDLSRNDNHVNLVIEDNGVGLPAGFDMEQSRGFGLTLVKMLSQQLGGSFSMAKHKGTRCKVEFDI